MAQIIQDGDVNHQDSFKFLRDTKHTIFIFNEEIDKYIKEICEHSILLHKLEGNSEGATGEKLEVILDKKENEHKWFVQEIGKIQQRFKDYLHIDF